MHASYLYGDAQNIMPLPSYCGMYLVMVHFSRSVQSGTTYITKPMGYDMSLLTEHGDAIRRAISTFLNGRTELRGMLKPISPRKIQIHFTINRYGGSGYPVLITSALDTDIRKFSQELCGKLGFLVRQLPNEVDNRIFELSEG